MKRSTPGSGSEDCCKNSITHVGVKDNCYINVKVLFENVCVRVCVRPYPPFPTIHNHPLILLSTWACYFKKTTGLT